MTSAVKMASNTRSGAGSPSHELGGARTLYSKRYDQYAKVRVVANISAEHGRFNNRKAYRSMFGVLQPVVTPLLYARIFQSRPQMASLTSHIFRPLKVCHKLGELEQELFHPAFLQEE